MTGTVMLYVRALETTSSFSISESSGNLAIALLAADLVLAKYSRLPDFRNGIALLCPSRIQKPQSSPPFLYMRKDNRHLEVPYAPVDRAFRLVIGPKRRLSWSMTTSVDRVRPSKVDLAFSAWWRKSVSAMGSKAAPRA
jgi:hypothetical protein